MKNGACFSELEKREMSISKNFVVVFAVLWVKFWSDRLDFWYATSPMAAKQKAKRISEKYSLFVKL
jgi:hypothetical protein